MIEEERHKCTLGWCREQHWATHRCWPSQSADHAVWASTKEDHVKGRTGDWRPGHWSIVSNLIFVDELLPHVSIDQFCRWAGDACQHQSSWWSRPFQGFCVMAAEDRNWFVCCCHKQETADWSMSCGMFACDVLPSLLMHHSSQSTVEFVYSHATWAFVIQCLKLQGGCLLRRPSLTCWSALGCADASWSGRSGRWSCSTTYWVTCGPLSRYVADCSETALHSEHAC